MSLQAKKIHRTFIKTLDMKIYESSLRKTTSSGCSTMGSEWDLYRAPTASSWSFDSSSITIPLDPCCCEWNSFKVKIHNLLIKNKLRIAFGIFTSIPVAFVHQIALLCVSVVKAQKSYLETSSRTDEWKMDHQMDLYQRNLKRNCLCFSDHGLRWGNESLKNRSAS